LVEVFSISSQGALSAVPGSPFSTTNIPYVIESNCAGNLVFVADEGTGTEGSLIDVYSMASNGGLTPIAGSPFPAGTSSTAGGMALSPNNNFLFVTDTFSQDISSLSIASDGALAQVPGSPFGTSNWTGGTSLTADGQFLYTTLFTVAQVDGRKISASGELSAVPGTPFSTGQAQTGVPTVTTFPQASCSGQ
jgi:6-phosphogluconolactonase